MSMLTRRSRTSRNALEKNGPHANSITGTLITHEAQRSSCSISLVRSPGMAWYAGHAYIITCIMQKPATSQRHNARRLSRWRCSRTSASIAGRQRYPARPTAAIHCDGSTCAGFHTTRARRVAAPTDTSITPGTCFSASSIDSAQAAQCMPSSTTKDSHGTSSAFPSIGMVDFGRPKAAHSSGSSSKVECAAGSVASQVDSPAGKKPGTIA